MAATGHYGTRHILVTGGAGFVGSNLVACLLEEPGAQITVFDNLSRRGVEHNLRWLHSLPRSGRLAFIQGDVRHASAVFDAAREADEIYHLAAQVAVTSSLDDPRSDFEVNAAGTLNVLEGARRNCRQPLVFFTSTNKVYGGLESVAVHEHGSSYRADDAAFLGASETTPLDFHSPYGCSKGAADQYVRDYARIYDLPTVVFRMSCIAGPRQFGNEDQGWVAHFLYSALAGKLVTIYGSGRQVRDILHVDDLVEAILAARAHLDRTAGQIYNIGGGLKQSASVLEMLALIERLTGVAPRCSFAAVRPGDQPLYISNIAKFKEHAGWYPRLSLERVLQDLRTFWHAHSELILEVTSRAQAACDRFASREFVADEVA